MQTQIIRKAPRKMLIEAVQGKRDFSEVDRLNDIAKSQWLTLYRAIKSGKHNCIFWNDEPVTAQSGSISFLRHVLTRSTKQENALQLTAFQIKGGEEIPLSDVQLTDQERFIEETPNTAEVHIF